MRKNYLTKSDPLKKINGIGAYNLNEILIGFILFSLPVSIKLNSICLILFFGYNLYLRIWKRNFSGLKYFSLGMVIYIIQFVAFLISDDVNEATKKLILFSSFPILAILLPKSEIKVGIVFKYLFYGLLIILGHAVLRSTYDIIFYDVRFDYGRGPDLLLKYTPHHAYLSIYTLSSILTVSYLLGKSKIRNYHIIFLPILYLTLFLLPSRMALIMGFSIVPIFMFIFFKDKYEPKKMIIIISFSLLVLSIIGFTIDFTRDKILYTIYEILDVSTQEKPFYGISRRELIWKSCIGLIKETPFLGYGIGDIQNILNAQYIKNGFLEIKDMNCHNQYLQNILQYGLFLSTIFLIKILHIITQLYKKKEILLLSIWLIILSFCFTESIFNRQWGVVFFAVTLNLSLYRIYFNKIKLQKNIN